MAVVHYRAGRKNPHHADAILAGWGARCVPAESEVLADADLHLIGGLQHGSMALLRAARAAGVPYLFFDRGYFGRGLRVVPDAYQHYWRIERPARFEVPLAPWRTEGEHVLLVPPANALLEQLFGLEGWADITLTRLRAATRRPVRVSVKPDPQPLHERLDGCWCVVTWSSNVAVDAICAGVPAIVGPESAARPVAGRIGALEADIDNPPRPSRERWAAGLSWGEYTLDEIASGYAREHVYGTVRRI